MTGQEIDDGAEADLFVAIEDMIELAVEDIPFDGPQAAEGGGIADESGRHL